MRSGFYSPYFIVPKKSGGLRPILDLRVLNRALHRLPFKMLTPKRIFGCVRPQDWFAAIDLKDAYFHVSILPRHRPFLRFAFEGRAYQYKVLPFGLSLSPRVFTKVAEAALVPLREQGVRILNYLDDWLILAQSQDQLCEHRDMVLSHLSQLGLQVNWEKSKLSPVQRISFLGMELDSVSQTARLTQERAQSVLNCLNTFKNRTAAPLKQFQRLLGHMAAAAAVTPLGLLHMRPLQHWLHGRVPRWAWQSGTLRVQVTPACRQTFTPWSDLSFLRAGVPLEQVSRHAVVYTDASAKGWGATFNGHAVSGVWTDPQLHWHINCLELLAVHLALNRLKRRLRGEHVLVRTDNTATVAYINRQGGLRSRRMSQLARHLLLWSRKHLRSLRAIHIPGLLNRTADELSRAALPGEWRLHPQTVQLIWRRFGLAQVDHCGGMTVAGLRTRLRFLQRGGVPVPLPRSRVPPGGYRGEATSGSSRAGLTVTVRNSPSTPRAPPVTGTSLPMELPRERAGPSHGGGVPLVSFGAPPDDRMSIATLEGESDQSGDDGSVPLPPSGRSAVPDSDPEMVAMLARAAESVGLEWTPPPCPEPSRLDDWFLGVARAGSQGPTPVPFFPEVHDELTGTWTAPFTARNRSSGSSSLATLDGGAARGYTEVPPVERSVAMQLCPRTASTWRGNPLLPSRACRHSSALTGSAYAACGEAASALHAMALLQVHQAKALRDLHEGGHDPGVLSELRTATDLALRATKVTARSLGRAMSTMVVQERHLWLCLADMKEVDKARFLNAPVSQTGLFGDAVENFAQQFSAAQKQTEAIRHILPRRAAAASTRPPAAVPRSTRRRGRPPAAAPAPAQQTQQPPAKQRRGAGRRAAAPPVQAPAKPGGKRQRKRP